MHIEVEILTFLTVCLSFCVMEDIKVIFAQEYCTFLGRNFVAPSAHLPRSLDILLIIDFLAGLLLLEIVYRTHHTHTWLFVIQLHSCMSLTRLCKSTGIFFKKSFESCILFHLSLLDLLCFGRGLGIGLGRSWKVELCCQ